MTYYDAIKKYMFKYLDNLKMKTHETNERIQFNGKNKKDLFLYVKEHNTLYYDGPTFYTFLQLFDLIEDKETLHKIINEYFKERYPDLLIDTVF
jgi:hypothetical protein